MKRTILLSVLILLGLSVYSQQKIEVETGDKPMSKGSQMAITLIIPEAKIKDIEPVWKKYINSRSIGERIGNLATQVGNIFRSKDNQVNRDKLKVETKGDEWFVRSVEESKITTHSLDVYARATDLPTGCQFSAFFQYTDSIFINGSNIDAERLQNIKSFIYDFGVEAYKSVVDDQIKAAKKEVSAQEKIARKLESVSRKEEKAISGYEVDIQEYESEIKGFESDIAHLDELIAAKKLAFSSLTKGVPEYDAAKGELKDLAKEKSKNFGKIKSLKSKIKSKEMDIKSSKSKIVQNEIKIASQQKVIEEKEQIVKDLEQKKERIQ